MFYHFSTAMERAEVLRQLRQPEVKLPAEFAKDQKKAAIVKWLLNWDSTKRPTTAELLKSDLLPTKLVREAPAYIISSSS